MNKKVLGIVSVVIVLVAGIATSVILFLNSRDKKEVTPKEINEKYVAYIKINPSIKLDYSRKCIKYNNERTECEEPVVDNYELVNDDAKDIFENVDLTANSKNLVDVVSLIFEKVKDAGIEIKDVEIQSDWNNIENYLEEASTNNNQTTKTESTIDLKEIIKEEVTVQIKTEENIQATVENDEQEEIRIKEEEAAAKAKAEAEAKAKAEAEAKAREAQTIYLSDNVTYCHSMQTYECDNCFSTSLINTLKNAKGHNVVSSSPSSITIKRITSLSGKYNSTTYFGTGLINKIKELAGDEVGGAGGCEDLLTTTECKEYNLICK